MYGDYEQTESSLYTGMQGRFQKLLGAQESVSRANLNCLPVASWHNLNNNKIETAVDWNISSMATFKNLLYNSI